MSAQSKQTASTPPLNEPSSETEPRPSKGSPPAWSHEDRYLLEGPRSRLNELLRLLRIVREFIRGFRSLHLLGPCVTVFGSARFPENHEYYVQARNVSAEIARMGFTVMTGGGPGIMEAANRGAQEVGGRSVGCNIELPEEQEPNPYIDKLVSFRYFFVRKMMLVKYSQAFVIFPGGFGTMDEAFEAATLMQTNKIFDFPVVFVGRSYWEPLFDFMQQRMIPEETVDVADFEHFVLTDSVDTVLEALCGCPSMPRLLRNGRIHSRIWQLRNNEK